MNDTHEQIRIVQETVAGKEITFAHVIGGPAPIIYQKLGLNPSIDYVVRLDKLTNGITHRTTSEEYYFGGKGINVSRAIRAFGSKSVALGFSAGSNGRFMKDALTAADIQHGCESLANKLLGITTNPTTTQNA